MKRCLRRLISLVLMLCLLAPAALAEGLPVLDELEESVRTLFAHGGALHAVTWDNTVYRQDEQGWARLRGITAETQFVDATDDAVWMLTRQEETPEDRACYRIERAVFAPDGSLGDAEPCCTVAWDLDADNWPQCYGFIVEGDIAYVLMEDPFDWELRTLYRVDLESGSGTKLLSERISELRRYKDGLLLARHFNWEEYDRPDGTHYPPQVVTIDPSAGTMTTVGLMTGFADGGLAYDAQSDQIYFRDSSRVYRVNGDAPEALGGLIPGEVNFDSPPAIFEGRYYIEDYEGIISASVDPSAQPERTLRIAHVMDVEDYVRAFARLHPEIIVEFVDDFPVEAEAITRHMQSSAAADLYTFDMSADYVNMRDKKYLLDLSGSELLMDTVNRMDSRLTAEIQVDGRLYAIPYTLNSEALGWYPDAMEQMGLSEPETYGELLDCVAAWLESEENEDVRLFEYSMDMRRDLFQLIYMARILSCQAAGETPTFDTPVMRALLERLETLTPALDAVEPIYDWSGGEDVALFARGVNLLPRNYALSGNSPKPLPLRFDDENTPTIRASMSVLIVNPYSENADIAIELLEYVAQHMPVALQTSLMPDMNDPIEAERYQENLAYLRETLADWEEQLVDASEEDRDILKEQIQDLRMDIAYEEQHRWTYTAEELAFYREFIEPNLTYRLSPVFTGGWEQTDNICSRYLDGQLSLDEFIREFDRVVWMMTMENQ